MSEPMTTEERRDMRCNVEVAILATLRACTDDCDAIDKVIRENDMDESVITTSLERIAEAASLMRTVRDECDMSVRADAYKAIEMLRVE